MILKMRAGIVQMKNGHPPRKIHITTKGFQAVVSALSCLVVQSSGEQADIITLYSAACTL